jgi:hypothetical protein
VAPTRILLVVMLAACDREVPTPAVAMAAANPAAIPASTSTPTPTPTPSPTPSPSPAAMPAPPIPMPAPPVHHGCNRCIRPPAQLPLPAPPPNADKAAYTQWFASLSGADRQRIASFCAKEHARDFDERCGGIGPLHLPIPPSLAKARQPGEPSHDDWEAALSPPQRAYYHEMCDHAGEGNGFTQLCGACPLVVSFDGAPIAFVRDGGRFALRPGDPVATDWPTVATPWLAFDRDGDGAITSGAELFGNATPLADGHAPANGFEALAALDANHDGRIDPADPAFAQLVLWYDRDGDRRNTPDELVPASTLIDAIDLDVSAVPRCTADNDCERERAVVHWHDATGGRHAGAVVDVYLRYR